MEASSLPGFSTRVSCEKLTGVAFDNCPKLANIFLDTLSRNDTRDIHEANIGALEVRVVYESLAERFQFFGIGDILRRRF